MFKNTVFILALVVSSQSVVFAGSPAGENASRNSAIMWGAVTGAGTVVARDVARHYKGLALTQDRADIVDAVLVGAGTAASENKPVFLASNIIVQILFSIVSAPVRGYILKQAIVTTRG